MNVKEKLWVLPFIVVTNMFFGCSTSTYLKQEIKRTAAFRNNHTGIALYDLQKDRTIAGYNDEKYFTPASNTKLFTYFAGLNTFGDSLPGIHYQIRGDSLFFEGTGDPSLFHPDLPRSAVVAFLKERKEKLFFIPDNFKDKRYGPGWPWSDYNDYYQPEKSSLPLYGNIARFTGDSSSKLTVSPEVWHRSLLADPRILGIERDEYANIFRYSKRPLPHGLKQDIPVKTSDSLTILLLKHTLGREVSIVHQPLTEKTTVLSIPTDSLYARLMEVSDNMLAEQLMLLYASAYGLPLNTSKAIEHALGHYLTDLPDTPIWKDGSGLSRYNLFTPRTMVALLRKIHAKVPQEKLFYTLRYQSRSALSKRIKMEEKPFFFAKTGSLNNNYNLSGYLVTKKGRILIFSIMNNSFVRPSSEIRTATEQLLLKLHRKY